MSERGRGSAPSSFAHPSDAAGGAHPVDRPRADESADPAELALRRFDCRRCGETIGVYEPLAAAGELGVRITSRAAEPDSIGPAEICYHRACYEQAEASIEANLRRSAWRRAAGWDRPA
jgi:hypothetical protein